jgi:deoxyribodipyrimidine photo-lyase
MSDPAAIQPERIQRLSATPERDGAYVLYWMQQSQRAECNHALEYAIAAANRLGVPVVVAFGLTDGYPEANLRHYRFMLEGLQETRTALHQRGIRFLLRRGSPERVALDLAREAALLVCDRGYTRIQRQWRAIVAVEAPCAVVQVESDMVVPVEVPAEKAEYGAHTLRLRLHRLLPTYLRPLPELTPEHSSLHLALAEESWTDLEAFLARLAVDRSVPPVTRFFRGGTSAAHRELHTLVGSLRDYAVNRGRPESAHVSHLSMYLHFGQISPLEAALAVSAAGDAPEEDRANFLEELIVRRELCHNWVHFTPEYDDYRSLPRWARETLAFHAADARHPGYTEAELERADTHDPYWNAAMREMRYTGYMHNKMRMYWGKKILEWSPSPEEAYRRTHRLNNRYFLDGRDPNSYAGVAWIFGQHDRPWGERPIYGKVRCMVASGLERKSDIRAYVAWVDRRVEEARAAGIRFPDEAERTVVRRVGATAGGMSSLFPED